MKSERDTVAALRAIAARFQHSGVVRQATPAGRQQPITAAIATSHDEQRQRKRDQDVAARRYQAMVAASILPLDFIELQMRSGMLPKQVVYRLDFWRTEARKRGLVGAEDIEHAPEQSPRLESVAPVAKQPTESVWVVVPHRHQSGVDSGGGFVAREADLRADGTIRLAPPYDGAPIQGKPYKRKSAADRLADKLSGYGPKKKVSRLDAAERIAKALNAERYTTCIRFDQEHPEESIGVIAERGTRPHEIGVVTVLGNGSVQLEGDFGLYIERQKFIQALVDKALDGLEPDPSLNPPPKRRMEISAREAAFDIAMRADDEARAKPGDPRAWVGDLAPHDRHDRDPNKPRQVILRRRADRAEVVLVDVFEDGRIEIAEDASPKAREDVSLLIGRALDGRRVVPSPPT